MINRGDRGGEGGGGESEEKRIHHSRRSRATERGRATVQLETHETTSTQQTKKKRIY